MLKFSYFLCLVFSVNLWASQKAIHFTLATAQLPPYVFVDENQQVKGQLVDKLKQAQRQTGLKIDILVMPWGRALNEVKNNRIDAIMPALWSQERADFLVFPEQAFYALDPSVLIKRKQDNFTYSNLTAIPKHKVIGKARLVMVDKTFDTLVKQGRLSVYQTTHLDEALLMLQQQKIDLVASESNIALTTIKNLGLEGQFTLYPIEQVVPASYIAFSSSFAKNHDINAIMASILEQSLTSSVNP
ncbi:substrate-binding periplasmic protein [Paraglaciecola aestuariivivens]